jgi:TraK protein
MKFFSLWLTCFCVSLGANQVIEMDSNVLFKCVFSSRHHNRIAVSEQRIKKVIYPEGEVLIRMEEDTGQIFVHAMVPNPLETTITVITSEGDVQDLEISFADRPLEVLLLKGKSEDCLCELSSLELDDERSAMHNIIESLLFGKTPAEHIPVQDRQICFRVKSRVMAKSVMRLIGPLFTVYVLHLENQGCKKACIHEKEINCIRGEWVFMEKHELKPCEKGLALIGVKTCEQ